ncbi:TRAP transporter large permease subunit [Roseomonas sp. OT10]|uniref:TRAP transporter large permease n=1 Tax=Roseomonas cutis TaxID=2897332 RepID=UPI001E3F13D8|nr:TRAP transporter large permease subunit [Roseomonas sp. OT10]UFN50429.1 TRAP transporter large permease subunit [Roseomonas sp. OT10]
MSAPAAAAVPGRTPTSALGVAARRLDTLLGTAVEAASAVLVLVLVALLFAGVVARYLLHVPLVWSDELSSILFLWLAMFGTAVALRRGAHMRMTAFIANVSPQTQAALNTVAIVASAAFLVMLAEPAWEMMLDELPVVTPALEISNAWRLAAIPAGFALMLVFAALQLLSVARPAVVLLAIAVAAVLVAAVLGLGPVLRPLGNWNLVLFFVGVIAATVFAGVPIGFAFGLATVGYLALSTRVPLAVVVGRMGEGMSHIVLLAVPLFVFLGALIEMNGMARAMVRFLAGLIGHVRGGLSYVLLVAIYLVSGIAGSKAADMAAVAPVLFPEMRERGSKPGELVALLAASGAMSETIPPSLVLITIGTVTAVSIADLFTGGLLPAVVLALAMAVVVWWRARGDDMSGVRRATKAEVLRSLWVAIPVLLLPLVIRFAVVEGIATATEVSTIGIVYGAVIGVLFYQRIGLRRLYDALVGTATLSGAILLIIGTATAMAWALTQSGFSRQLAGMMEGLPGGAVTFMAISVVAFIILGSLLEGIPAVVLFGPLLFPIARDLHIHEVHYAIVVILAMGIGLFAPPFGVGYYTACAIAKVSPDAGMRPIVGYLVALTIGLIVVAAVPWFSIGLLAR